MAPTIDSTVGGASANSYVTLAEANTYFDSRFSSGSWASATTNNQTLALLSAAQRLERERFVGSVTSTDQALAHPRGALTDREGRTIGNDEIAQDVQDAQCEMALGLITSLTSMDESLTPRTYSQLSIGTLSVTYRSRLRSLRLPDVVLRLLKPYLVSGSPLNFSYVR